MPSKVNELSHQPCKVKGRVMNLAFNHMKVMDLILSTTWKTEHILSEKSLLFLSFHISQTVAN